MRKVDERFDTGVELIMGEATRDTPRVRVPGHDVARRQPDRIEGERHPLSGGVIVFEREHPRSHFQPRARFGTRDENDDPRLFERVLAET